jgi:hypothetical protein
MLGLPTYAVATLVANWSPKSVLALYGVIDLFYLLPSAKLARLLVSELRRTAEPAPDGEAEEVDPRQKPTERYSLNCREGFFSRRLGFRCLEFSETKLPLLSASRKLKG